MHQSVVHQEASLLPYVAASTVLVSGLVAAQNRPRLTRVCKPFRACTPAPRPTSPLVSLCSSSRWAALGHGHVQEGRR
jgi:hypothetical protein